MEALLSLARQAGFSQLTQLDAAVLNPMPEVRDMCSADRCRSYGKSWSCPPACGSIEYAARRISQYRRGLIVQTTGELEDEFDLQAIAAIEARHKKAFLNLARQARLLFPGCLPFFGSNDKLTHIADGQPQAIQYFFPAALKGAILHLDAGVSVVSNICQCRNIFAPVHISQARQLR